MVLTGQKSADIVGKVAATNGLAGGQVHVTAESVTLGSGAVVDASGESGGGEVLIGGGWQGGDARIANARNTLVDAGATIKADAKRTGTGGTIVAWSDGRTRVYGSLSARGGALAGDGGKIETSGHVLDMQAAAVDTRAPNGLTGSLLLDPDNVFIADSPSTALLAGMSTGPELTSGPAYTGDLSFDSLVTPLSIQTWLNGGTSVVVKTSNTPGSGTGNITRRRPDLLDQPHCDEPRSVGQQERDAARVGHWRRKSGQRIRAALGGRNDQPGPHCDVAASEHSGSPAARFRAAGIRVAGPCGQQRQHHCGRRRRHRWRVHVCECGSIDCWLGHECIRNEQRNRDGQQSDQSHGQDR